MQDPTLPSTPSSEDGRTLVLLRRWHDGEDAEALGELLERDLPWIQKKVEARMGGQLRARAEAQDYIQDAMLEVLRYGPRFELANRAHFRSLMARIIENVLRDKLDWWNAKRRQIAKERPLPAGTCVTLDPPAPTAARPSQVADRRDQEAMLRLALELLEPEDREVLVLRQWQDLSFSAVANELGVREDAARMRFQRALPKLAQKLQLLREGRVGELVD